jgi:hypothetical protein
MIKMKKKQWKLKKRIKVESKKKKLQMFKRFRIIMKTR